MRPIPRRSPRPPCRGRRLSNLSSAVLIMVTTSSAGPLWAHDWQDMKAPNDGPSQAIGSTSLGCLTGGIALPAKGTGFESLRRWRNRFYGTEELIGFLTRLGNKVAAAGLPPLLIGDMAQARGGPLPYGHVSHQTGIDVDILFTPGPLTQMARETLKNPLTMLEADHATVDPSRFGATQITDLKLAANDPKTQRIFVNFHIKRYLCETLPVPDRGWLHKLRPWLGHDEHFHVRLNCPADSPLCRNQAPVPAGDGCGADLYAWFRPPSKPVHPPKHKHKPKMPSACASLLTTAR